MRNTPPDSPEPEPIDPHLGVPLIRAGDTGLSPEANPHPYRFADPADLFTPSQPAADYGLLLATQTFRVLFPRVKIDKGADSITGDLAPLLADPHAMLSATGLFPQLAHAIAFPSNAYRLHVLGEGQIRLSPSPLTHTVPPRSLQIVKAAGVHAYTEYRGGDRHQSGPATIALRFDSTAHPSWGLTIGPMSTVTDVDPFGPLMRMITTLQASSTGPPRATKPLIEFGGALQPVEELLTVLHEFGLPVDLLVETPNSAEVERNKKVKAKLDLIDFELRVPGKITGEIGVGYEIGTTRAVRDVLMPGGVVEISVEIEGSIQLPIFPLVYGGGLFRLHFATGYEQTAKDPVKREIKLSAAAVGSVGGAIVPHLISVEGEIRYGYVLLADFAKEEYYPGVLFGFSFECEIGEGVAGVKVGLEGEVIGFVKRVDDEEIHIRAETTIAGEIELCDILSFEYSIEVEYDQKLPSKAIMALAGAAYFGLLPPIPP
ncbi:hypothetical protein [Nonomuraea ceibae]|uniref:hypothetical protein n=1 Tax=Nonomuraea ceibae TaxID=1935170 RepID=UPI001C5D3895|nr:hypothetical protein [Nonomuraea ceibae]